MYLLSLRLNRMYTFVSSGEKSVVHRLSTLTTATWPEVTGSVDAVTQTRVQNYTTKWLYPPDQLKKTSSHSQFSFILHQLKLLYWGRRSYRRHIYKIVEKLPLEHFEGNHYVSSSKTRTNLTRMCVVILLWVSLTKYQSIIFIMNSSNFISSWYSGCKLIC